MCVALAAPAVLYRKTLRLLCESVHPQRIRSTAPASSTAIAVLCVVAGTAIPVGTTAQSVSMTDAHLGRIAARYDDGALERLRAWQALIVKYPQATEPGKQQVTNDFFNQIPWLSDEELWGKRDYWASPTEMLGRNGGDCEDFSIGKFFTLKELGVAESKLLITYVRARTLNQAHMVLAYYPQPGAEPLILDNLDPKIRPASQRKDLVPVYSFNGTGLWMGIQQTRGNRAGSAKRIAGWRKMLRRFNLDLIDSNG
jgi:predicted transglutaminase-like cysteine proteinase